MGSNDGVTDVRAAPAKVRRPSPSDVLPRERLFQRLDALAAHPITWISGPAGSGKTTLVGTYVEARRLDCLWYQVDSGDADLATFFHYLRFAGAYATPREAGALPSFTQEYHGGIPEFSRNFFEHLTGLLTPPAVLIFDNLQEVPGDALLFRALREAVRRLPSAVRLMLVSREAINPVLIPLQATRQVGHLGWDELRLNLEECQTIIESHWGDSPTARAMDALCRRIDGWAAGLQLALGAVRLRSVTLDALVQTTPQEIFDYLTEEVFRNLEPQVRHFLLRASFLPSMTEPIAERLTGHPKAGELLSFLHRKNYFTEMRPGPEPSYQFHPLFREFLTHRARRELSDGEQGELQRLAAHFLREAGEISEAAHLLRQAEDWPGLVDLILTEAGSAIGSGRYRTVEEWIRGLPDPIVQGEPWLQYWIGVAQLPFSPVESRRRLERAFGLFRARGDGTGMLLAWSGTVDSISWELDRYDSLDPWARRFEESLRAHWPSPSMEITCRVTGSMLFLLTVRQPWRADRAAWLDSAHQLLDQNLPAELRAGILAPLMLCHLFAGELSAMRVLAEEFRRMVEPPERWPLGASLFFDLETFLAWLDGRFEECRTSMEEGLDLSARSGVHLLDGFLLGNGAMGALSRGDLEHAQRLLDQMQETLTGQRAWELGFQYFARTWAACLGGETMRAVPYAQAALREGTRSGCPSTLAAIHLAAAQVHHGIGEEDRADRHLVEATNASQIISNPQMQMACRLTEAHIAFDRGDEAAGLTALERAFAIGRRQGYVNWWLCLPVQATQLCVRALAAGIEVDYVRKLVRQRDWVPAEPPLHLDNWPWPLRIHTLGRFQILVDDKPLRSGRKAPKRPLTLLKALLALGGSGVPEARLLDALWPETDGDLAHQAYESALHRLRAVLGVRKAVERAEGTLTLDARYSWVDAWAFERQVDDANRAWESDAVERAEKSMARAAGLYRGPFLAQDTEDLWTVAYRERLRGRFQIMIERLGLHLEATGRHTEAIEQYREAIAAEPSLEVFYQRLIACYGHLDRKADATSTYRRCCKVLEAELGTPPSEKTTKLFRAITSAR